MKRHELSAAYPEMPQEEFLELVEDIRENGQYDPCIEFEGAILDGWHRYRACQEAGIKPWIKPFEGDDPVAYVRAHNTFRRHLTASQRAAAEIKLRAWRGAGRPENKHELSACFSEEATNREMAEAAGVSERTIQHAKEAERAGLGDEVRAGHISARKAAEQSKDTPRQPTKMEKLEFRIAELEQELQTLRDANRELEDELNSWIESSGGDDEQQRAIATLRQQIRALKSQLNEHKMIANDFKRENRGLRKQLGYKN